MEASRRRKIGRAVEDAALFGATVLVAFWAFGDRSPAWLTPIYAAAAFAVAVLARRLIVRARARRNGP